MTKKRAYIGVFYMVGTAVINGGEKWYPVFRQFKDCPSYKLFAKAYARSYIGIDEKGKVVLAETSDKIKVEYFKTKAQAEAYCKKHTKKKLAVVKKEPEPEPAIEVKPEPETMKVETDTRFCGNPEWLLQSPPDHVDDTSGVTMVIYGVIIMALILAAIPLIALFAGG